MKTIIVPTDFSETAGNACDYALALAKETGAKVILFHAFHVPIPATEMPVLIVTPEELEIEHRRKLELLAGALRSKVPGVTIELETRAGFAVEEIANAAREHNADLLVMGMHEMRPVDEILIGSTTTDVIDRTHCPVLVIPGNAVFSKPDLIAFASDYKDVPKSGTLNILKELAHVFDAKVDVLNVIKPEEEPTIDKAVACIQLEHQLEDVNHTHHFPVSDNVQQGISNYVEQFSPGMLAMVHRKHNFLQRLFGESHTQKAAFHTHIPLLAMRA
jgi:nucleotide-binding universal stress UspA family protein